MGVLLTNDDGIFAPGLAAMYAALSADGEVSVVAPHSVQSGGSHAVTIRHPVLWHDVRFQGAFRGVSVEGTPADCVKLALNELLTREKPDLVVSGINAGLNTGVHVIYSGTVAAAIEAAILGCPAVAVSLEVSQKMDYAAAADIAKRIIDRIRSGGLKPGEVYNINIPTIEPGRPKGLRVAPQSTRGMVERIERRQDPSGRDYYWLSGDFRDIGDERETDRRALLDGYVCVTPLHFDLTDAAMVEKMRTWDWPDVV